MVDGIADQGPSQVKQKTLWASIRTVDEVAWTLDGLVFGKKPAKEEPEKSPVAADNVTRARNRLDVISSRLRNVADRLKTLGS